LKKRLQLIMENKNKTKEELQKELLELKQENNSLRELYDKEDSFIKYSNDPMLETNLKLTLAMRGGNMAWWEMDVLTGNVTFDKHKVEMLGYIPEKFKHYTDFTSLVHPNDYKNIMKAMQDHLDGILEKYEAEYRILTSSGEYIWFYDYGSVVKRDATGAPLICTGFVYNISERKNAEKRLLKITKALDSASDAIAISDSKGHHFYHNKAFSNLFGYETMEEVVAAVEKARVKDPTIAKQMYENILHGKSWSGELEMVTKSGRIFPAYDRADAIKDIEGNIIGLIGIITDITERKQNEEILVRKEGLLSSIYETVVDIIYFLRIEADECYRFISVNTAFLKITGLTEEMVIGKLVSEVIPEPSLSIVKAKYRQAIKENSTIRWEETTYYPTKKLIGSVCITPVFDGKGFCTHLVGSVHDITEHKQAEEILQKSDNMLQTVLDNFPGVVFWKDRQSNYLGCNKAFAYGAGLKSNAEIIGKTDHEMPWALTEAVNYLKDDKDVMECGKGRLHIIETQHQANGQVVWLDTSKFPMMDSSGEVMGVIGVSSDISMLKTAEQKLIFNNKELVFQNEEKEKRAAELAIANKELAYQNREKEKRADELMIANKELLYQNEEKENRAAELIIANKELAYQNGEKAKRAAELITANKELAYQNREKEKRADELIIANKELLYQNEEKENRAAELIVANKELAFQNEEKAKRAAELITANKELAYQNREKEKRSDELFIANKELLYQNEEKENRAAELVVANKELAFQNEEKGNRHDELMIANKELLYQNVEKEKRAAELTIAKDKAEESNRLKTAFLNNISHEIRTPFNGIIGLIPLLIDKSTPIEEKEEYVNMINFSADRFMNTINDIIEVSQIQSGDVKEALTNVNIHEFINRLINIFKPQFEIKKLEFRVQNNIPKENENIFTDSIKLQRILSNLLYNALNFTEEGIIELEANIIKGHITFSVKDTGIGISENDKHKIFDKFVQADVSNTRKYQGTGLGLSIAKVYTETMGGEIWVESELNIGSTFNLKLPIGIKL